MNNSKVVMTRDNIIKLQKDMKDFETKYVFYFKDFFTMMDNVIKELDLFIKPKECKYCHKITDSIDEDVLCSSCRENFGHTFYSEL